MFDSLPIKSWVLFFSAGILVGGFASDYYHQKELKKIQNSYIESVANARKIEETWKRISDDAAKEYQRELDSVKRDNEQLIIGLRKQLSDYASRVSKLTKSTSGANGSTRESKMAENLGDVVNFSYNCSRRADELIIQLRSLQNWIKDTQKIQ